MSRKNRRKKLLEAVELVDAGAKGKAVGKSADGKVVFVKNAVPGDVADIQTFKKRKNYIRKQTTFFISVKIIYVNKPPSL